jgi:hypothetical protein
MISQSLAVVGADFPNKRRGPGRRFEIAVCKPGDRIELRPEPNNPADQRAIAVYSERDVQLGYLRAEHAYRMTKLFQSGIEIRAIFQEATRYGAAIRVAFDGEEPVLPQRQETPPLLPEDGLDLDHDQEWYPDEVWPDE